MLIYWLVWPFPVLLRPAYYQAFMRATSVFSRKYSCSSHPYPWALMVFPPPLVQCSLGLRCRGCVLDVYIEFGQPVITRPLHFNQLWSSVAASDGKKKLLWWDLRVVPLYEHKDENLETSWKLYCFSSMVAAGLPLGPLMSSPTGSGLWLQYYAWLSSCWVGFRSN